MKKHTIAIIAVIASIGCLAFAKYGNAFTGCNTTTNYVWYQVQPGLQIACGNYSMVTQGHLVLDGHTAVTLNDPLLDNNVAGFQLLLADAITKFGCPSSSTYICYVAYNPADVTITKFIRITLSSGEIVWAPKTDANKPIPVCSICRPQ